MSDQERQALRAAVGMQEGRTLTQKDLDFAKAVATFEQSKVALQAAQQSFVQVKDLNLFNYI